VGKKVAQKVGVLLKFSKRLPKVNNHPIGENSPNLVTLDDGVDNQAVIRFASFCWDAMMQLKQGGKN
jgi:hypothetical protein